MSNLFNSTAKRLENSPWIILIWSLFLYGLYLGITFWLEDYNANLQAYLTIPTRKALEGMVENMARFIQIAPMLFGFVFLRDTNKRIYGILSFIFLFVDWGIGTYYRSFGLKDTGWIFYAAIEDLTFFTLGSEVLVTLTFGIVLSSFPAMLRQTLKLLGEVFSSLVSAKPETSRDRFHDYQKKPSTPQVSQMQSSILTPAQLEALSKVKNGAEAAKLRHEFMKQRTRK